jgi:purine-binding chemotaxis protein CheW
MQHPESFLTFTLEPHSFAVRALSAREVVRAVAITPARGAPEVVEGTIDYRGRIVPVLDIRSRFGLEPRSLHPDQHFIVLDTGSRLLALRVDRAHDLVDVPVEGIASPGGSEPGESVDRGFSWMPDGLVVIHDIERLLSADERSRMDAVVRAAGRQPGGEAA